MAQPKAPAKGKADSRPSRDPKAEENARKPLAPQVADFHSNSDVDSRPEAQHHTLGPGVNQATPGSHNHDATDPNSQPLWTGVSLTDLDGSATTAQLASAITALNALIRAKSGG